MKIRVARKPEDAYQHGNLRQALVQAGLKLLSEGGLASLSLRAAAQLAGVSHAAPYRHFRDKDALVAAIAEEGFALLTAHMQKEQARCAPADIPARLQAIGLGYVGFALEHPGYFRVIFSGLSCPDPESPALAQVARTSYQVLRDLIVEGITSGVFRAGDPDTVALAAWSMVHGLGMLALDGALRPQIDDPAASKRAAIAIIQMLQDGLLHRDDGHS